MNPVELEEFAVSVTDLLFHVTIPEVRRNAIGSVRLFVQGDVIRAFELDDILALGFVVVIPPGFDVLEQG